MKRKSFVAIVIAAVCLSLAACGTSPKVETQIPEAGAEDTLTEESTENEDEAAKIAEEEKAAEEEAAEEAKKAEEEKAAEEAKKAEEENTAEEAKKAEEEKAAEEAKKAEEEKAAEEAKKAEEEKRNGIDEAVDFSKITMLDEEKTMYVQSSVNVRTGPDKKYDRVDTLRVNTPVQVLGQYENGWYMVKNKDKNAFISNNFLGENEVDLEALKAQQEAEAAAAAQAAAQQANAQPTAPAPQPAAQAQQPAPAPVTVAAPAGVLFIGDSRTCQMRSATGGGGCTWICEYAQDYNWFANTAVPQADPMVGKGTKVVICMGVNDPGSLNSYASLTNQKAAEWGARGAKVYFVSLNPVDHPYEDKIPQLDSFNAQMPGLLAGVRWIDTASVIKQGGFVLEDGIHYDTAGNVSIFNMIIRSLK